MEIMKQLSFEEYKRLSSEEKEIHDFELQQRIYTEVRRTNGRVGRLETKWLIMTGAIIVISAIVVPIFLNLLKLHSD
jgi:hypothetical protein